MTDIKKISKKIFLKDIIKLREEGLKGLNDDLYTHIKPGQDAVYVRKMKDLINTYLNL